MMRADEPARPSRPADSARLPRACHPHLPDQDRHARRRAPLDLRGAFGGRRPHGGFVRTRRSRTGRSRRLSHPQRSRAPDGALCGAAGTRAAGRHQHAPRRGRGGLHPRPLGREAGLRRSRAGAPGEARYAAAARRERGGSRRGRPGRTARRSDLPRVRGRRDAAPRARLGGRRGSRPLHQLHVRYHRPPQGRDVHPSRRHAERAGRSDPARSRSRVGLPLVPAAVPLQRLVLPLGGDGGGRHPRDAAQDRSGRDPANDPIPGRHAPLRRADRVAHARRGARGEGTALRSSLARRHRRRAAVAHAARTHGGAGGCASCISTGSPRPTAPT